MLTSDIMSLIPQRPPILMVNRFECGDEEACNTELDIRGDNMFLSNGHLTAEGILEHIAQTAAAYIGYRRKLAGEEVNLGFIGDIKKCVISKTMPTVGQTVKTSMRVVSQVGGITMIAAESKVDNETILSCRMKLAN
ncbi:MAG: hydroxymyristoyl-ACP dehydratase [Bacteroidales bacterium]|nr:hydroxymyristoyl-ACP dehydratase [Bacteroidales bacterium]